ncbi:uncharacterized protein [Littorina saxatilis]|uniref:Uncharacterized protein n=1 Tax=Littorina saxatilis TaxID=31220 RepID=A0AAN9GQ65_9CAEN
MQTSRAVRGSGTGEVAREMDSIYSSHPIPSIPRAFNNNHHHHQQRPLGDSMLAYTERMREISKFRKDSAFLGNEEPPGAVLEVQARHIPKVGLGPRGKGGKAASNHRRQQRRPHSLDELIGRPGGKEDASAARHKNRRFSEPGEMASLSTLPSSSPLTKYSEQERRIKISFVSAADLFDLVDFSLRSKKSRNDSIKLARAEDTLKLINDVNVFRSAKQKMKPHTPGREEDDEDVDNASLFVHGTASPREDSRTSAWVFATNEGHGDWAKNEVRKHTDPYDSDDEGDDNPDLDVDRDLNLELVREKSMLLLQPHKLRFRPKRAKRMKLHRSRLSIIPEDERHRQEAQSAHEQEVTSSRLPVMPTSSSLAAIKDSRKSGTGKAQSTERKKSSNVLGGNQDKLSTGDFSSSGLTTDNQEPNYLDKRHRKIGVVTRDNGSCPSPSDLMTKKRHTSREDFQNSSRRQDFPRRYVAALNDQTATFEAPNTRAKAQKKFRKLIFLRDQPEQPYHRYS